MAQFDVIVTNPPFQDTIKRGKTPHKLWIDFTKAVFDRLLVEGGLLCQVSPSSFQSPSNAVLELMKRNRTACIRFGTGRHFPEVGSTFSDYLIYKVPPDGSETEVIDGARRFEVRLDAELFYLPNVTGREALSVHRKVIFRHWPKLRVERDYVSCHNVLLTKADSLSKIRTERHVHPVLHTNRQVWWSSVRQPFADLPKVMWSRSGYTKPFYDGGELGGTDMVYFVKVEGEQQGRALSHNMNLSLMRYIYSTARWSGFGNEKVFAALPALPTDRLLSDAEMYDYFRLSREEVLHVRSAMGGHRKARR